MKKELALLDAICMFIGSSLKAACLARFARSFGFQDVHLRVRLSFARKASFLELER